MKYLLALVLFCTTVQAGTIEDVATSTDTFAVCKAADVVSTAYVISRGFGAEANPVVAGLLTHGYFPFILVSIGVYYLVKQVENRMAVGAINAITCGAAVNNLLLIK